MSGGANRAFLANPLNWLRNNVLIIAVNPTDVKDRALAFPGGVVTAVNLVKINAKGTLAGRGTAGVYELRRGSADPSDHSHQFQAYYLPWEQNGKKLMNLDQAGVNYFFTDTMNGCTFATGPGANPKVGHFNYQIENTRIDTATISNEVAGEFAGGTLHRLDKAGYMDTDGMVKVTTLGIKTGNAWTFYYQRREIVSLIPPKWNLLAGQPIQIP